MRHYLWNIIISIGYKFLTIIDFKSSESSSPFNINKVEEL